jgi:hypothetical protein
MEDDESEQEEEMGEPPPKKTRTRRSKKQLAEAMDAGGPGVTQCSICLTLHTKKAHECSLKAFLKPSDPTLPTYEAIKTQAHKQFLSSALKPQYRAFAVDWIMNKVERQHGIKVRACLLLQGFIASQLQSINMESIGDVLSLEDGDQPCNPILTINQTVVKSALSHCSKEGLRGKRATPLRAYHEELFAHQRFPQLQEGRPSQRILSDTSLQNCARALNVNFISMMELLVWKETKHWMLRELTHVLNDFRHRGLVKQLTTDIRWWLTKHIASRPSNVQTRTELKALFVFDMEARWKKAKRCKNLRFPFVACKDLWKAMRDFLVPIVDVLHPLEVRYAQKTQESLMEGATKKKVDDEQVAVGDEKPNKPWDVAYMACRRAEWLMAVLKRLEGLQSSAQEQHTRETNGKTKVEGNTDLYMKLWNLFPQTDNIPCDIQCGNNLLSYMAKDWDKSQLKLEKETKKPQKRGKRKREPDAEEVKQETLTPTTRWQNMFKFDPLFWFNRDKLEMVSKITTDGESVSFLHTSIETVARKPHMTKEEWKEGCRQEKLKKIDKIEGETVETLQAMNVTAVLALDTNRKNFVVGTFTMLDKLLNPSDDDQKSVHTDETARRTTPVAMEIKRERKVESNVVLRITKGEYRHVREIKRINNLHQQLKAEALKSGTGDVLNDVPPSIKGSSPLLVIRLMQWYEEKDRLARILQHYRQPIFRRLRMESYMASQRFYTYVQDKIYTVLNRQGHAFVNPRKLINPKQRDAEKLQCAARLLIVLGDGDFQHNSRGHITQPSGSRLFRELRLRNEHIRWVNEHRTSLTCSVCTEDMVPAIIQRRCEEVKRTAPFRGKRMRGRRGPIPEPTRLIPPPIPTPIPFHDHSHHRQQHMETTNDGNVLTCRQRRPTGSTKLTDPFTFTSPSTILLPKPDCISPWGLRVCCSTTCHNRLWCRDVNACRNMHNRVGWILRNPARSDDSPPYLRRMSPEQRKEETKSATNRRTITR